MAATRRQYTVTLPGYVRVTKPPRPTPFPEKRPSRIKITTQPIRALPPPPDPPIVVADSGDALVQALREAGIESIAETIRWAMALPDDVRRTELARLRSAWEVGPAAFAERIAQVHRRLRVVSIHSPHERCGIREYGRQLDDALAALGHAPLPLTFTAAPETLLAASGPSTAILMHFEPSLLPPGYDRVLRSARDRGARVVYCCHWFDRNVLEQHAAVADRLIVHRSYGIGHERISEVPLGCPEYEPSESKEAIRRRLGLPLDRPILTTLGFLSPWKRLPDTLDTLLARLPPHVYVQALTPHPFLRREVAEEQQVQRVLSQQKGERVYFSTEFRPERELLDRVHASDLGFLYHGQHTHSVSAAVKQFVSARTPLVATGSSHASDIQEGIARIDSLDLGMFAAEVARVFADTERTTALRLGMAAEYERLRMRAVAQRYLDIFGTLRGQR